MLAALAYARKAIGGGLVAFTGVATADGFPAHNLTGSQWSYAGLMGLSVALGVYNLSNGAQPTKPVA